jgi:hypothetical protein
MRAHTGGNGVVAFLIVVVLTGAAGADRRTFEADAKVARFNAPAVRRAAVVHGPYTKTFRASSQLASEKRLDARLILFNAAVTMRYAEYLPDVDGFFTPFDADARSAKTFWLLGGGGF